MFSPQPWTFLALTGALTLGAACSPRPAASGVVVPTYSKESGRLDYLDVDRNKDGKFEARAFMDGIRIQRVEIDLNGDGKPDRWEYYGPGPAGRPATEPLILRAEEVSKETGKISRWEYYEDGLIVRVEEDTNDDGRIDKWEGYRRGRLETVDLDLAHTGTPQRRLVYHADNSVTSERLNDPGVSPNSASVGTSRR